MIRSFIPGLVFVVMVGSAFVQDDCMYRHYGTKTLYRPATQDPVKVPDGYKQIFVNYVGRHGARHLTNLGDENKFQAFLMDAQEHNGLTEQGLLLLQKLNNLVKIEKAYKLGTITEAGQEELKGIGYRMSLNDAPVFQQGLPVKVVSTKEQRTVQSADAFLDGLNLAEGTKVDFERNDSVQLRFYEIAPGYRRFVKGKQWMARLSVLAESRKAQNICNSIVDKFLTPSYRDQIKNDKVQNGDAGMSKDDFVNSIYSAAIIVNALSYEIRESHLQPSDVNIAGLLSCDEVAWMDYMNSAKDYLVKGPGIDANGIQVRNAVPLLVDFINSTDIAIEHQEYSAVLRFAHAETISPFAALLQIEDASEATEDIARYNDLWHANAVIPFSANIMWNVYRPVDANGDVLIAILYNEKPVRIPVVTDNFPYYKWKDVKAFYLSKLQAYHVGRQDDMYSYLKQLK